MTTASIIMLLQMALSLLTSLQAHPDLPVSFRNNAFATANFAIATAQKAIVQINAPAQPAQTAAVSPAASSPASVSAPAPVSAAPVVDTAVPAPALSTPTPPTPAPATVPTPVVEVPQPTMASEPTPAIHQPFKEIRVGGSIEGQSGPCSYPTSLHGACGYEVLYFEDGQRKSTSVTISSDTGKFTAPHNASDGATLGPDLEGNPLTANMFRSGYDGYPHVQFTYIPTGENIRTVDQPSGPPFHYTDRTITITANGVSKTIKTLIRYEPDSVSQ